MGEKKSGKIKAKCVSSSKNSWSGLNSAGALSKLFGIPSPSRSESIASGMKSESWSGGKSNAFRGSVPKISSSKLEYPSLSLSSSLLFPIESLSESSHSFGFSGNASTSSR